MSYIENNHDDEMHENYINRKKPKEKINKTKGEDISKEKSNQPIGDKKRETFNK
jgi:2-methylcitrate dehydratase PrpD